MLLMGLRLTEGLDLRPSRADRRRAAGLDTLARLIDLDMIEYFAETNRVRATTRGRFVLNKLVEELAASFVPAAG